jgi:hypothetical protein
MTTAWKADLIVRKARPFSVEELSRRARAEIAGAQAFVASAEDTILSKLEWAARGGGSELQLRDARGIVQVRGEKLDLAYLDRCGRGARVDGPLARRARGTVTGGQKKLSTKFNPPLVQYSPG